MPYICSTCNAIVHTFQLSCPDCGQWNSLRKHHGVIAHSDSQPVPLPRIESFVVPRIRTKIEQLDSLLGSGLVPGSSVLVVGPPGAGKSTLVIQILKTMNIPSLYVTGEESIQQLKVRADRLKIHSEKILFLFETNVNTILAHIHQTEIQMLVIDSIQTMYSDVSHALPGSPTQIRKSTYILRRLAQQRNLILIIVGQVTKTKAAAGPKLIEHAVDVVLHLDILEDQSRHRILLASKNRFGSTAPRCMLYMRKTGLVFQRIKQ
jgi:DNA repair protein RadA/Sms